MRVPCIIALLVLLGSAPAQTPDISGTWKLTYDADMRRVSDTEWKVNRRDTGTLVLQQRGDSVFGSWQARPMPQATTLAGTFDGRTLRLASGTREMVGQVDGRAQRMAVRTVLTGSHDGRALRGVMFFHIDDRPAPARRWEAVR